MPQVTRGQLVGVAAVFVTALALRLPYASDYLWAWDSVLYARALESFDVAAGRPHPPGYIFYVGVARLASGLIGEANAGLVLVSIVGGAGSAAVAYFVGSRAFGTSVGVLAAAILVAAPILWHYSEVAYPYTLLALLGGAVGALLWWARSGPPVRSIAASLALGAAAGFRQDILLLLGPLWLWAILGHGRRAAAASCVALALACLTWLVPTAALSGGVQRYASVTTSQAWGVSTIGPADPQGALENLALVAIGLRWQLLWLLPLAPLGLWVLLRRGQARRTVLPMALWMAPAVLTYILFHIGEWAYTLSVAVPFALLAAIGGVALLEGARSRFARSAVAVAIVAALVLNAQSFLFGEGRFSVGAIEGHDRGLALRFEAYRERFPASETVLIAEGGFQHVRYYLPEYRAFYVPPGAQVDRRSLPVGPEVRRALLFLGEIRAHPRTSVRTLLLSSGLEIRYVALERRSRVVIVDRMVLVEPE